jgi:hypothetical protein
MHGDLTPKKKPSCGAGNRLSAGASPERKERMKDEKIYPVVTFIDTVSGKVDLHYRGEYDKDDCPYRFSSRTPKNNELIVPLWFPTDLAVVASAMAIGGMNG